MLGSEAYAAAHPKLPDGTVNDLYPGVPESVWLDQLEALLELELGDDLVVDGLLVDAGDVEAPFAQGARRGHADAVREAAEGVRGTGAPRG